MALINLSFNSKLFKFTYDRNQQARYLTVSKGRYGVVVKL